MLRQGEFHSSKLSVGRAKGRESFTKKIAMGLVWRMPLFFKKIASPKGYMPYSSVYLKGPLKSRVGECNKWRWIRKKDKISIWYARLYKRDIMCLNLRPKILRISEVNRASPSSDFNKYSLLLLLSIKNMQL